MGTRSFHLLSLIKFEKFHFILSVLFLRVRKRQKRGMIREQNEFIYSAMCIYREIVSRSDVPIIKLLISSITNRSIDFSGRDSLRIYASRGFTLQAQVSRKSKPNKEYNRQLAEESFKSLVRTHEKYGWVTPPLAEG